MDHDQGLMAGRHIGQRIGDGWRRRDLAGNPATGIAGDISKFTRTRAKAETIGGNEGIEGGHDPASCANWAAR